MGDSFSKNEKAKWLIYVRLQRVSIIPNWQYLVSGEGAGGGGGVLERGGEKAWRILHCLFSLPFFKGERKSLTVYGTADTCPPIEAIIEIWYGRTVLPI